MPPTDTPCCACRRSTWRTPAKSGKWHVLPATFCTMPTLKKNTRKTVQPDWSHVDFAVKKCRCATWRNTLARIQGNISSWWWDFWTRSPFWKLRWRNWSSDLVKLSWESLGLHGCERIQDHVLFCSSIWLQEPRNFCGFKSQFWCPFCLAYCALSRLWSKQCSGIFLLRRNFEEILERRGSAHTKRLRLNHADCEAWTSTRVWHYLGI